MKKIFRCYKCKYINIEEYARRCPLCKSKLRYLFLKSSPQSLTKPLLEHIARMNFRSKTNYALWEQKKMEWQSSPYIFYIEKHSNKDDVWIKDQNRIFINIYDKINNTEVYGDNMWISESDILRTMLRLMFRGIKLKELEMCGETKYPKLKRMRDPLSWAVNIIKANVKLLLRNVNFLEHYNKKRRIETCDLIINPKLLAYLELCYNQGLLSESGFIERQTQLLELMDLYKDYTKWENEYNNLVDTCINFMEKENERLGIKKKRIVHYDIICPRCGSDFIGKGGKRRKKGEIVQAWQCYDCRKLFVLEKKVENGNHKRREPKPLM